MIGRSFFAVTQAFFGISPALVYLVAGLQGAHGDLSAGTLVAFTTLQTRLLMPINQLLQVSVEIQSSMALFGRIFELSTCSRRSSTRPTRSSSRRSEIQGEVALENVSFRYPAGEAEEETARQPAQPSRTSPCEVAPGQLAALVGPSGAGKTTISYLVPRLYDVESGAVRIDGHDVRDSPPGRSRRAVGVVTQESYLFGGTVRGEPALRQARRVGRGSRGRGPGRVHPRPHLASSRTATRRWSASAATASPAASASASRSPASSSRTRRS